MRSTSLAATAASLLSVAAAKNVVSLVGDAWTLTNPELNVTVPGHLPSSAHLDLLAAQVIGDPYYGLNDFNLRWVAWANWTYVSDPIKGLAANTSTWLLFNGLDTFTSIEFCGQHVASTNNQFRQYWFDISSIAQQCTNATERVLSINFGSAPNIANAIAAEPGAETWPEGVELTYEFDNRWFIRKEQSDFGWDWGPAFAPAGPWQPAWVVQLAKEEVYVRNSIVDVYREGQLNNLPPDQSMNWVMNASIDYFGSSLSDDVQFQYTLKDCYNNTVSKGSLQDVNVTDSTVTGSVIVNKDDVLLWWPTGMGQQNLYYVDLSVVRPASTYGASNSSTIASLSKRIGFRTIVLNENPISEEQLAQGIADGTNWHFEINGHEFYAKGSNFIPPDAFWTRVTPERMAMLFDSVVAGNQNMLRVWASGAYSPDYMYDLADEMGILLWSEFEFGDALYPVAPEFLENVRQEAEYNVRRVNHHPSLALWAGGNELESLELILLNRSAPEQLPRYKAEYETLFLDTLLPTVFGNSRSISYTPSSTSNGWQTLNFSRAIPIEERYYNTTPGFIYGEADFYNYDPAVLYDDGAYPVGRFSNEFGYHSMPSIQSWRQQISPKDLSFNSTVVFYRDHHNPPGSLDTRSFDTSSVGQAQMTEAVEMWYPIPDKTDSVANFSAWIHATQIFQADLYKSEIVFYRRGSGRPERQLGSLYWQLEDIWVAPSWAGIEYDGRWKVLHYTAKDVYQPVIIAPYYNITTGNLSVWATSDLWEPVQATATLQWYDWSGNSLSVNTTSKFNFEIGAINSTEILQTFVFSDLKQQPATNAVLHMSVEAQGSLINSNETQTFKHDSWLNPTALQDAQLVDPGLELTYSNSTKNFTVEATSGVAAWVWLDYPSGAVVNFDSNAFWLAPGCPREVGYTVKSDTTNGKWVEGVTVESMWNQTLPN